MTRASHCAVVGVLLALACGGDSGTGPTDESDAADTGADHTPEVDTGASDDVSDDVRSEPDAPPRPGIPGELTPTDLVLPVGDPPPEVALPDGVRIRVATFNIHGGGDASAAAIGAMLATLNLDVVGLQECPAELVPAIAEAGGFESYSGSGTALLSRHPLVDPEPVALVAGRGFIRAQVTVDEVTFAIYNVHVGWDSAGDLQMRELVDEHLALEPIPHLVLLGDLNDEHGSTQITILEEAVTGAFEALGWYPGQRISWPATEFDGSEGSQHIDLIFSSRELEAIVVDADVVNLAPVLSDHKPVWADLLYPRRADAPFATDPFAAHRDIWRDFPAQDERPANRLTNPGAEDGLTGWAVDGGAVAAGAREEQQPRSGEAFFTGFSDRRDVSTPHSSGAQTVDLTDQAGLIDAGRGRLLVSGYLTTGYQVDRDGDVASNVAQPYDEGELLVDALDDRGEVVLRRVSGRRDTLTYRPVVEIMDLPPGARGARLTWLSHQKAHNGSSNDAVFDDLYLGFQELGAPHALVGGNRVVNPGGESGDLSGWESEHWKSLPDLQPNGLTLFMPWSYSGRHYLFAGPRYYLEDPPAGELRLSQWIDLEDLAEPIDADELAVRWGGYVRTWAVRSEVRLSLEIVDQDGQVWGTSEAEPVTAAEWTRVEALTRLPRGVSAVRLVVTTELEHALSGAYADELFVIPERLAASE